MDVTSFGIDHDKLLRGLYVSRKDKIGAETITTFDVRMKEPNREPVMDTSVMHTLEHLIAVYLRGDSRYKDDVLYVGPMGCRTGMYIIFKGDWDVNRALPVITEAYEMIVSFQEKIPATEPAQCGNCLDHNLVMTQYEAKQYLKTLQNMTDDNMIYPML